MNEEICRWTQSTPLGFLEAEISRKGVHRLEFANTSDRLVIRSKKREAGSEAGDHGRKVSSESGDRVGSADPEIQRLAARLSLELEEWFAGHRRQFEVPLQPAGTPFQRSVWRELESISFGATRSYGEIAERIGNPRAVRAVAAAIGANPVVVLIPCHRVIGKDGSLTGYAAGLRRKEWLLAHERDRSVTGSGAGLA